MPYFSGLEVHITDSAGNSLDEWGTQHLRQTKKISTFIQSATDMSFNVSIRPIMNWPATIHASNTKRNPKQVQGWLRNNGSADQQPSVGSSKFLDDATVRFAPFQSISSGQKPTSDIKAQETDRQLSLSSPLSPTPRSVISVSNPPFSFLASLYLDGRKVPERRLMVYTNRDDEDFPHPDGEVVFRSRWVQAADSTLIEHAWVFRDRAIETVFDKLVLAGENEKAEVKDEDGLADAMDRIGIDMKGKISPEEKSKIGQIIVQFERVIIKGKGYEPNFCSRHKEGNEDDVDKDGVQKNITHAAGFVRSGKPKPNHMRTVEWEHYKPGEGSYATFRFFYRNQEELAKYNFRGFPTLPKTPMRHARGLNSKMANLTPLSISDPRTSKSKKLLVSDAESYESKVQKKAFKAGGTPKYTLRGGYREARAEMSLQEDDVVDANGVHRAVSLPLKVDASLKSLSRKEIRLPSLPTVEEVSDSSYPSPPNFSNVGLASNLTIENLPPRTLPNPIRSSPNEKSPVQQPLETKSKSKTTIETSNDQCMNSDPVSRSASMAPRLSSATSAASLNAEHPSSSPSFISLSKKNFPKLSLASSYRVSPDPNEDADDELASEITDSDLETHLGDSDGEEYSQNPEEDERGENALRSRFGSLIIGKRVRDESEEGEVVKVWERDRHGAPTVQVQIEKKGTEEKRVKLRKI